MEVQNKLAKPIILFSIMILIISTLFACGPGRNEALETEAPPKSPDPHARRLNPHTRDQRRDAHIQR
jgi:hypothetical protein